MLFAIDINFANKCIMWQTMRDSDCDVITKPGLHWLRVAQYSSQVTLTFVSVEVPSVFMFCSRVDKVYL